MEPITPPNAPLQLSESTPIKVNHFMMLPFTTTAKYCYESCIAISDVPAWLGLKATALAWPEVALAF
jgi:hypothetical protein